LKPEINLRKYKGIDGICMETDMLAIVLLPSQGAKLCSIYDKVQKREYVYQGKTETYQAAEYGQSYLIGECAGIDEMFPNIDECFYDAYPWKGTALPDHGEIWAIPWDVQIGDDCLSFETCGVRLPYRLSKTVTIREDGTVRADYTVENLTSFPLDYIWAAHMMFEAEKGCVYEFPPNLDKAYCTLTESGAIGCYGDTFPYPIVPQKDGSLYDVRIHRGSEVNDYQKFYFCDRMPQGWAGIRYPDGAALHIRFPVDTIPYLGVLQGEGGPLQLDCMFLEPCSGAFDRPDIAKLHRMNSVLQPREKCEWYLEINISSKACVD